MNIYLNAGLKTLAILVVGIGAGALFGFLSNYIGPDNLGYIGLALLTGGLVYMLYMTVLNKLRYDESLKNLNESINKITGQKFDK